MGKAENSEVHAVDSSLGLDEKEAFVERLLGQDPSAILPRLSEGDPLGIQVVCMRRLRELAFAFDPDRVFEKVLAELAFSLSLAAPGELGPDWMQSCVDRALLRLVDEDREAEANDPQGNFAEHLYGFLHDAFATPLELCRAATVEFNRLPHRARMAFFMLLVDNRSVEECLDTGWWEAEELRMDVWHALRALGHLSHEEVEQFRTRKTRT